MNKMGKVKLIVTVVMGILTVIVSQNEKAKREEQQERLDTYQQILTDPEVQEEQREAVSNIMVQDSVNTNIEGSTYTIPAILIASEDAMAINKEILETYNRKMEEEEFRQNNGEELIIKDISYESYYNTAAYSLVIIEEHYDGSIEYTAYNVSARSGRKLSNGELITSTGMTNQEFTGKLLALYGEEFIKLYGERESYEEGLRNQEETLTENEIQAQLELYDEQYNNTIDYENYDIKAEMFLNKKGNLCVAGKIYSMTDNENNMVIVEIAK